MGRLGTHAVYASSGGSPHPDARLASGCWPDSTGWALCPTGFLRKVSSCFLHLSPFPRLTLAQARVGLIDECCKLKGKQDLAHRVNLPTSVAGPCRVQ